jgi:dTDP-4-amino-4,6-dideoxygalactose transaminase
MIPFAIRRGAFIRKETIKVENMEIGSEFNIDFDALHGNSNTIYDYLNQYDCVFTSSGRSAIRLLLENAATDIAKKKNRIGITANSNELKVLLPEYICNSVIDCFEHNYSITFYALNPDLSINMDDLMSKIDNQVIYIYIIDYFGSIQNQSYDEVKEKSNKFGCVIIEDTTHSIFSREKIIGDYCICSLRKLLPIPDGGVLYSPKKIEHDTDFPKFMANKKITAMVLKNLYLSGELKSKDLYREIFVDEEQRLDTMHNVLLISDISAFILSNIDINEVISSRKRNYLLLQDKIEIKSFLQVKETDCPFSFVVQMDDRDNFREYLIKHNIYCAVHWPIENQELLHIKHARTLSQHLISLPIDQRYGEKEMGYLAAIVNNYTGINDEGHKRF